MFKNIFNKTIRFGLFCLMLACSFNTLAETKDTINVGVLLTLTGPAGLFGPASKNLAELAKKQINARGGILGKEVKLFFGDAGLPPADSRQMALKMWKKNKIDVFVGMHNSAVRVALTKLFKGKVPYIYTATHSGGECSKGTYITGETPQQQLEPVIPWLAEKEDLKKWYLIGNDYNWPRLTNKAAKQYIKATGGVIVGEEYLPFSVKNFDSNIAKIKKSEADVVLITLVGGGSVNFNRSFAQFGLDKSILRLGTLIEANTAAGVGPQNSKGMYGVSGYFANIESPAAKKLKTQYYKEYGKEAPLISSLAESVYEGMMFLEAIAKKSGSISPKAFSKNAEGTTYYGPRGKATMHKRHIDQNIYLAKASQKTTGAFTIIKNFGLVGSGSTCSTE